MPNLASANSMWCRHYTILDRIKTLAWNNFVPRHVATFSSFSFPSLSTSNTTYRHSNMVAKPYYSIEKVETLASVEISNLGPLCYIILLINYCRHLLTLIVLCYS